MEKLVQPSTLILFVDALGYDFLARRPFLPGFWQVEAPLETLIGYSSSIVPAIWSGLYPDEMSSWNEFYYEPRKPYFLPRLLDLAPHRYLRNLLRRVLFRYGPRFGWYRESLPNVPTSVEYLFSRKEVCYWKLPPVPLGAAGLDARLRDAGIPFRFWFTAHGFKAADALADLRAEVDQAQVFIYGTATIDGDGHLFGPSPSLFNGNLTELEEFITGARDLLSRNGEPNIIVISDHGMTAVTRQYDMAELLKPWRLGSDYVTFLDSTMARFWDVGNVPLEQIVGRLEQLAIGRFLTAADRRRFGLEFADNRYGDAIFLLDPGYIFSPSFMESPYLPFITPPIKGMHGYDPDHPSTAGVFLYHGSTCLPDLPTSVVDVMRVFEELLELTPAVVL